MRRMSVTVLVASLGLCGSLPSAVRAQESGDLFPAGEPGPIRLALYTPEHAAFAAPLPARSVRGTRFPLQEVADPTEPPLWQSLVYGLGAKIVVDGLLIDFAGDTFHALPSLLFIDPVVTAAGVHIGNETRGSFLLDLLSSYGTLYLFTSLFYGEFMPAGQFEDPTSYGDFWTSVGIQFVSVVLTERISGRAVSARKRR